MYIYKNEHINKIKCINEDILYDGVTQFKIDSNQNKQVKNSIDLYLDNDIEKQLEQIYVDIVLEC